MSENDTRRPRSGQETGDHTMKTKSLALVLALILTVSCCPLQAAAEEEGPAPGSDALLTEGTRTVTMEQNQLRSFYTFMAETPGEYTFRIDGPAGEFTCRDGGWITPDGVSVTASLAAGETAYFTVRAHSPGAYHLSYVFTGTSRLSGVSGLGRSFTPAQSGFCIAAVYDENGKMLTAERKTMTEGERCTVFVPYQTGMAYMKVFRLSETLVPLCEPAVLR